MARKSSAESGEERGEQLATEAPATESGEHTPAVAQQRSQQFGIGVDDAKAIASYSNFCRVTGTPEELIIDFGLNKDMGPAPASRIDIAQRIIVNFYTAKRLLAALHMAVQRHEAAFGVLETDVQKRVLPAMRAAGGTATR